ncbi:S-layer homology domain-containing protein [Tumebacillus flagellatus]|uniref:SLH domain-containing protein n=1 Tax=Tumebacillus flagellatus TaxID=1157490 RepID=A0A074LQK4_9BACL|nr:S-layer homology domain-containing protein [Tumebacillus flagellatus]KEO82775.1 hypothetical protein EL26_13580 [Tumebacillus flagellatus]
MKKRWSAAMAAVLAAGVLTTVGSATHVATAHAETGKYKDVTDDAWFAPALKSFSSVGLINGYPDGTFQPDNTVTRAEFLTILYNIVDRPTADVDSGFTDVAGTWYEKQVKVAREKRLFDNLDWGTTFDADKPLTRGETVELIWNLCGFDGYRGVYPDKKMFPHFFDFNSDYHFTFKDIRQTPQQVRELIGQLEGFGVVHGFPDGTFKYTQTVTRAEATLMLQTTLMKVGYPKFVPDDKVYYNKTSNANNLVPNGDGTYSFGNIYVDENLRQGYTEAEVQQHVQAFLRARVTLQGDQATIQVPDTGTDSLYWYVGTDDTNQKKGQGPFSVNSLNSDHIGIAYVNHNNAKVYMIATLRYKNGVWSVEY